MVVPSPPINEDFLNKLLDTQETLLHTVGNLPLQDYIKAALERRETNDHYGECKVAQKLGLNLRLVAKTKNLPIYPQPRVLRYAAFMGMQLLELDVPSSHGQQALKYAREHGLERTLLERAFATTKKIRNFRRSLDMDEVLAKTAINMIVGGSGLVNVKTECSLPVLHDDLLKLRQELEGMRQHMWDNCPPEWVNELKMEKKKYVKLTLASWHYQLRDRHDLERVTSQLPEGVVCHGWTGDNVLVSSDFDASAFCRTLAGEGIYMTVH